MGPTSFSSVLKCKLLLFSVHFIRLLHCVNTLYIKLLLRTSNVNKFLAKKCNVIVPVCCDNDLEDRLGTYGHTVLHRDTVD